MPQVWRLVPSVHSEMQGAEFTICALAFLNAVRNFAVLQRHQGRATFPEWSEMSSTHRQLASLPPSKKELPTVMSMVQVFP